MKTPACLFAFLLCLAAAGSARAWGWTNDPWTGFVTVAGTGDNEISPRMGLLAGGRTLICWNNNIPNTDDLQARYQVLDPQGIPLQPVNGLAVVEGTWRTWAGQEGFNPVLPDGQGGGLIILNDERDGTHDLWGQRVDSLGNRLWGSAGLPLVLWPGTNEEAWPRDFTCDSLGNYYLTWLRYGTIYPHYSFYYVLKFTADGTPLWGPYGVQFRDSSLQGGTWPKSVPDGSGGVFEVWQDNRFNTAPATLPYLYKQHINAQGQPLWAANGAPVRLPGGATLQAYLYQSVPDGSGGSVWTSANLGSAHIWRLDSQGTMVWLWTSSNGPWVWAYNLLRHPLTGTVWGSRDMPDGYHLYGFNVQTGQSLFGPDGLPYGGVVVPTSDGVISIMMDNLGDLSARHLDDTGGTLWGNNVYMGSIFPWDNYFTAVSDGNEGALLSWEDTRQFVAGHYKDIDAQRLNADGTLGMPAKIKLASKPAPLSLTPGQISFTLEQAGPIQLDLFDILGCKVAVLENGYRSAGEYRVNLAERGLASGVYLLRLEAGGKVEVGKAVVVK